MKTSPTGIRFDIDSLEFIKHRENIHTPQQVVNFLVSEYMKIYKVEKPSIFLVGENDNVTENKKQKFVALPKDINYNAPQIKNEPMFSAPINLFEIYKNEFDEAKSYEQLEKSFRAMEKDNLTPTQKGTLKSYAGKVKEDKGFFEN